MLNFHGAVLDRHAKVMIPPEPLPSLVDPIWMVCEGRVSGRSIGALTRSEHQRTKQVMTIGYRYFMPIDCHKIEIALDEGDVEFRNF